MLGFSDPETGEIAFSFVDQGLGIPTTLRSKWKRELAEFLFKFKQSDLVAEATHQGKSRLMNVRRGNGLPTFHQLLQNAPEGRFRICSNRANAIFYRNVEEKCYDSSTSFDGTLISWVLKPSVDPQWTQT